MAIFDPTDLTWNGKEVQELGEIIIEKAFVKPTLSQIHSIRTGIKAKTQIGYLSRLGMVGKKQGAGCAPTASTTTVTGSQKFWEPEYIEDRWVECWKNLQESFWIWGLANGIAKPDLDGTDFMRFMTEVVSDAMAEAVLRIAWFSDEDAANYNDSPAGVITNAVDPDFFNPIDGFWKQIFDIVAANSARYTDTLQSRNGQATYALQAFTSTDTTNKVAISTFEALKYNADFRLREQSNLVFMVTQSVFDQYAKELRSQSLDTSFERIEGGYNSLMFEGIPIVALNFWDRNIRANFDNETKYYRPHRALLTTKDNLVIGTENEGNFSEIDVFYDKKEKQQYVDFAFNIDAKVLEDTMLQVAY
jgi:hypothetical protein